MKLLLILILITGLATGITAIASNGFNSDDDYVTRTDCKERTAPIPEPLTMATLGTSVGFLIYKRRRKQ